MTLTRIPLGQLLNDPAFALAMLRGGLMAGSRGAVAALAARPGTCVSAFQRGLRSCLDKVVSIKVCELHKGRGLLDILYRGDGRSGPSQRHSSPLSRAVVLNPNACLAPSGPA